MKDFLRRPSAVAVRDSPSSSSTADRSILPDTDATLTSPRMSILPSVRIPLLRRQENDGPPSNKKPPLLSLCLSSQSFLDSCVKSDSGHVLYEIKTSGTSTGVLRSDSKHGLTRVASVKWPRVLPSQAKDADVVLVQMKGGRWTGGDALLRHSSAPSGPRKFNIPEYSESMKWKRYGTVYWCTTTAVKGPIAVLEMGKASKPTKLTLYETLHDKYDPDGLTHFQGVSVLLMDYVLTTALLLVTDVQEWMVVQKYTEPDAVPSLSLPSHVAGSSLTDKSLTSDPQLRKIMYGEPIYPKLSRQDLRSKHSSSSTTPSMPGGPLTPTSSTSGIGPSSYAYSTYGEASEDPSAFSTSAHILGFKKPLGSIISASEYDDDYSIAPSTRPPSPATESVFFSHSQSGAPGHKQFDPMFYGSSNPPPVPPLPAHFHLSSHTRSLSQSRSSSGSRMLGGGNASLPASPTTSVNRAFHAPAPPSPLSSDFPAYLHASALAARNGSSSTTMTQNELDAAAAAGRVSPERAPSIRSVTSTMSRSGVRRPLPRPPPPIPIPPPMSAVEPPVRTGTVPTPRASLMPRRAQSSVHLRDQYGASERAEAVIPPVPTRPQRTLPQPPPSSSNSSILKPLAGLSLTETSAEEDSDSSTLSKRARRAGPSSPPTLTIAPPTPAPLDMYGRRPPITKVSQEELTSWVHSLTSPQRDLPPEPLPSSSIYDVPPPAYDTINFGNREGGAGVGAGLTRQGTRRRAATQVGER